MVEMNRIQRGMAFVYETLSPTRKVILTCRHNFILNPFPECKFLLGGNRIPLMPVSPPLFSQNKNEDIAFFVAHDPSKQEVEKFKLNTTTELFEGKELINSKCIIEPYNSNQFPFYIMNQEVFDTHGVGVCNLNLLNREGILYKKENTEAIAAAKQRGDVIYPMLGMVSKAGCSGSPIFDSEMNLYGIDVRGVGETDQLLYVPALVIEETYKSLENEINRYK
jgi:hypothetical protein